MKNRLIIIITMCVAVMMCLSACNKKSSGVDVDMNKMREQMLAADESLPEMTVVSSGDEDAKESFPYLSKIDYDKVADYFLTFSAEGKADEIAVIELKSKSDMAEAKASLEEHLKKRHNTYEQYEPEEVPRVDAAKIVVKEQYIALIICDNDDNVKSAFLKMFEN
jgi:hypothetical protein